MHCAATRAVGDFVGMVLGTDHGDSGSLGWHLLGMVGTGMVGIAPLPPCCAGARGCSGSGRSDAHVCQQLKPGCGESGWRHRAVAQAGGLRVSSSFQDRCAVPRGQGATAPVRGGCVAEGSSHESLFLREALMALWGAATG